jgi:hypothetical protein
VTESTKALPTAVAGCTSHVSESIFAVPADTNSGLAKLNVVAPPFVTVATLESEPSRFDASRILQSLRFATEPFALVEIMSGIEVTLKFAPVAPTEILARATSLEPAGTDGAVSRLMRSTGPSEATPAESMNVEPFGVEDATSQRTVKVVVPVEAFTASGEFNVNVLPFVPNELITFEPDVSDVPELLKTWQFERFPITPPFAAVTETGSAVTFPPPFTPESVSVPMVWFVPAEKPVVTGVEETLTLPAVWADAPPATKMTLSAAIWTIFCMFIRMI